MGALVVMAVALAGCFAAASMVPAACVATEVVVVPAAALVLAAAPTVLPCTIPCCVVSLLPCCCVCSSLSTLPLLLLATVSLSFAAVAVHWSAPPCECSVELRVYGAAMLLPLGVAVLQKVWHRADGVEV